VRTQIWIAVSVSVLAAILRLIPCGCCAVEARTLPIPLETAQVASEAWKASAQTPPSERRSG